MFCSNCGTKIDDDARFCPSCGAQIKNSDVADKAKVEDNKVPQNGDEAQQRILTQKTEDQVLNSKREEVSRSWQRIFDTFDKTNAYEKGIFRMSSNGLSYREKLRISFSILAFLFGPLYYLCKGMFLKAFLYTAILSVITLLVVIGAEVIFDYEMSKTMIRWLSVMSSVFFAVMAKYDYYLYKCHGIKYVRALPVVFRKTWFCVLLNILVWGAYLVLFLCAVFYYSKVYENSHSDNATVPDSYATDSRQNENSKTEKSQLKEQIAALMETQTDVTVTAADFNDYWEYDSYRFKLSVNDSLTEGSISDQNQTIPFTITKKQQNCILVNLHLPDYDTEQTLCYENEGHGLEKLVASKKNEDGSTKTIAFERIMDMH